MSGFCLMDRIWESQPSYLGSQLQNIFESHSNVGQTTLQHHHHVVVVLLDHALLFPLSRRGRLRLLLLLNYKALELSDLRVEGRDVLSDDVRQFRDLDGPIIEQCFPFSH